MALGLGTRGPAGMELVSRSLSGGGEFERLEAAVRRDVFGT
jgi:hypothetical protein